jgi:hypothetical protein
LKLLIRSWKRSQAIRRTCLTCRVGVDSGLAASLSLTGAEGKKFRFSKLEKTVSFDASSTRREE